MLLIFWHFQMLLNIAQMHLLGYLKHLKSDFQSFSENYCSCQNFSRRLKEKIWKLQVACESKNTARCSRIAAYPDHCVSSSLHRSLICWLFPCLKNIFTVKQPLFLPFHNTSWQKWHVELLLLLFTWDCKVTAAKLNFQPISSFCCPPSAYFPWDCQV